MSFWSAGMWPMSAEHGWVQLHLASSSQVIFCYRIIFSWRWQEHSRDKKKMNMMPVKAFIQNFHSRTGDVA
jgi:hypothetical protein